MTSILVLLLLWGVFCDCEMLERDRQAMNSLKESLNIVDWTDADPCFWRGVYCGPSPDQPSLEAVFILDLYHPPSGSLSNAIGDLADLKKLYIHCDESSTLSGPIPSEIGNLVNLLYLSIWRCPLLSGPIPNVFSALQHLEYLDISECNLTGAIPPSIYDLSKLRELWLYDNKLTGDIPSEIGGLVNLERLDLSNNQLEGAIPASFGSLASLERLYLDHNNLEGAIPASLGNLASLIWLNLDHNKLEGFIPASLGNLASLEHLYLSDNPSLIGHVPPELAQCTQLWYFSISNTNITRPFPECISALHYHYWYWRENHGCDGAYEHIDNLLDEPMCACTSDFSECGCGSPDLHCPEGTTCVAAGLCSKEPGHKLYCESADDCIKNPYFGLYFKPELHEYAFCKQNRCTSECLVDYDCMIATEMEFCRPVDQPLVCKDEVCVAECLGQNHRCLRTGRCNQVDDNSLSSSCNVPCPCQRLSECPNNEGCHEPWIDTQLWFGVLNELTIEFPAIYYLPCIDQVYCDPETNRVFGLQYAQIALFAYASEDMLLYRPVLPGSRIYYESDGELYINALGRGLKVQPGIWHLPEYDAADHTVVYNAFSDTLVVTIRGTILSLADIVSDLMISATTIPEIGPDVFFHSGFAKRALEIDKLLTSKNFREIQSQLPTKFVGHSLGAGVAAVLTALYAHRYPGEPVSGVGFATPVPVMYDPYNKLDIDFRSYSFRNDVVTRISLSSVMSYIDTCASGEIEEMALFVPRNLLTCFVAGVGYNTLQLSNSKFTHFHATNSLFEPLTGQLDLVLHDTSVLKDHSLDRYIAALDLRPVDYGFLVPFPQVSCPVLASCLDAVIRLLLLQPLANIFTKRTELRIQYGFESIGNSICVFVGNQAYFIPALSVLADNGTTDEFMQFNMSGSFDGGDIHFSSFDFGTNVIAVSSIDGHVALFDGSFVSRAVKANQTQTDFALRALDVFNQSVVDIGQVGGIDVLPSGTLHANQTTGVLLSDPNSNALIAVFNIVQNSTGPNNSTLHEQQSQRVVVCSSGLDQPSCVRLADDGKAIVFVCDRNGVQVVDVTTGAIKKTLTTTWGEHGPTSVAFNEGHLIAADPGRSRIVVFNVQNASVVDSIALDIAMWVLTLNEYSGGRLLYAASFNEPYMSWQFNRFADLTEAVVAVDLRSSSSSSSSSQQQQPSEQAPSLHMPSFPLPSENPPSFPLPSNQASQLPSHLLASESPPSSMGFDSNTIDLIVTVVAVVVGVCCLLMIIGSVVTWCLLLRRKVYIFHHDTPSAKH